MYNRNLVTALATVFLATAFITQVGFAANEEIIERVKPTGQLIIKEEGKAEAADTSSAKITEETATTAPVITGKTNYDTACFACHGTGVAGAPIVGEKDAWVARISKGKDTLYKNAINGINTMPAKGGATSLSDEDVKVIVDYMIEQSS